MTTKRYGHLTKESPGMTSSWIPEDSIERASRMSEDRTASLFPWMTSGIFTELDSISYFLQAVTMAAYLLAAAVSLADFAMNAASLAMVQSNFEPWIASMAATSLRDSAYLPVI